MSKKRLNVLIVGLPLFSKRLARDLSKYDPKNRYTSLNTYYSKIDKLKYFLKIRKADVVYSINGTLSNSGSINLALKHGVTVIFHWGGTDVIKSTKLYKENKHKQEYINKCVHWCGINWIQEELKEININAEINNFASIELKTTPKEVPKEFSVLSYISQHRSEFYGINELKELAKTFPNITFKIIGSEFDFSDLPNMKFLGWVDNASELIDATTVCVRFTEHDGISNFVLESLSKGKVVLYNNNMPGVLYCKTIDELKEKLEKTLGLHQKANLKPNMEGYTYIKENCNKEKILGGFVSKFKKLSKK